VSISLSFSVSRTTADTPATSEDKVLYPPMNPISRQTAFRVGGGKKEKTSLPKDCCCITELTYVAIQYPHPGWGILSPPPFEEQGKAQGCRTSLSLRIG
jgi:hypothetical protein